MGDGQAGDVKEVKEGVTEDVKEIKEEEEAGDGKAVDVKEEVAEDEKKTNIVQEIELELQNLESQWRRIKRKEEDESRIEEIERALADLEELIEQMISARIRSTRPFRFSSKKSKFFA